MSIDGLVASIYSLSKYSQKLKLMSHGKIFIKSLEVFVNIGTTPKERAEKQRLLIDVEIEPQVPFEEIEDDINRTVNYDDLCSELTKITNAYTSSLIETLAVELTDYIKLKYSIKFVAVTIYKFVLPNTKFVAVRYETNDNFVPATNQPMGLSEWLDD